MGSHLSFPRSVRPGPAKTSDFPIQESMASRTAQVHQGTAVPALEAATGTVFLMRHATAEHNGRHHFPHKDPSLASSGIVDAQQAILPAESPDFPDLILISPMTRALQTAQIIFSDAVHPNGGPEVQIWPDLRESNNTISSQGRPAAEMREKFPTFDFSECHDEWDYGKETHERAVTRAEKVRARIKGLTTQYRNIWVITHSIFLSYLVNVEGCHFWTCESRKYRFATKEEAAEKRYGLNHDFRCRQDFGPTVLVKQD
ncbi:phosphoglycerate mutase family protein [Seiridium cupressi]